MNKNIAMNNTQYFYNDDEDIDDTQYDKENFQTVLRLERIESSVSPIKVIKSVILVCYIC